MWSFCRLKMAHVTTNYDVQYVWWPISALCKKKKKKKSNVSAFRDLSNKVLLVVLLNDSTCGRSTDVSAKSKFICSWSSTYCRTSHYFLIFNLFDFGSKAIAHLFKDALLNLWFAQYVTSFIFFLWPGLKYIKDLPSVCIVHAEAMKQWLTVLNCTKEYCKKKKKYLDVSSLLWK